MKFKTKKFTLKNEQLKRASLWIIAFYCIKGTAVTVAALAAVWFAL